MSRRKRLKLPHGPAWSTPIELRVAVEPLRRGWDTVEAAVSVAPAVRADSPVPRKAQASHDDAQKPLTPKPAAQAPVISSDTPKPHEPTPITSSDATKPHEQLPVTSSESPSRSPSPRHRSRHSSSLYRRKTTESTSLTGIRGWWRRMWGESEDRSRGVSYLIRIYERERAEKVCQLTYAGLFALFLTLFAYFVVNAFSTGPIVRVRTEMGLVSGELRWVLQNNVFHYLGLPYASKPARFQRAGPADRLRLNHIVAQFPGVRCMQVVENGSNITWPKPEMYGAVSKPWYSEDCLYLNIWSPVPPCDYTSDVCHASAPVVVVLFSVGFAQGGADWYDGALLASLGGVVVVAPNFRLGPLAVPLKEDQPQEVPLLSLSDQMLAIKWTWHNIKYFGGNTTEISLLGAGGGAWTVGEMVFSNRENVRDIIKRVLLHGGSPLQRYAPFRAYLRLLGPPATILAAEPKQDTGIDILVGYVAGQGRRLASDFFHDIARDVSSGTSDEDTLTRLQDYLNFTGLAPIFDKLRRDTVHSSDIWPRFLEDLLIRCPIELLGDLYRVMHATIYGFVYDDDNPFPSDVVEMPFPDLDMLFGVPLVSSDPPYPEHMKETSLAYMKVWSTFIRKGRLPSVNGNPWPLMIEDSRWTATSVVIKAGMRLSAPTRFVHKTCEKMDALLLRSIKHPDSDSSEFATEGSDSVLVSVN
ncbi:hypothetical protein MTO96_023784 [Rhipicephalus appendiculatus]